MTALFIKRLPLLAVLLVLSSTSTANITYYHPSAPAPYNHSHSNEVDDQVYGFDSQARAEYEKEVNAGNANALVPMGLTYLPSGQSKELYTRARQTLKNSHTKDALTPYLVMKMVSKDGQEIPAHKLKKARPWFEKACGKGLEQGCVFYRDVSQ